MDITMFEDTQILEDHMKQSKGQNFLTDFLIENIIFQIVLLGCLIDAVFSSGSGV